MQKAKKSIFRLMHQIKLCSLDEKGLGESLLKKARNCENKPYFHLKHNQKEKKKKHF